MRFEKRDDLPGGRLVSPSAERNKEPVAAILRQVLPAQGLVLEVSSGTGQHVVYFAAQMPQLDWQPTEYDEESFVSIGHWLASESPPNVRPPLRLDVHDEPWPVSAAAAVVCMNMIHIAPWSAAKALVAGAAAVLSTGGVLFLYGPYRRGGQHTSPSNAAFDEQLRARNPHWGVRDLEAVAELAAADGFGAPEIFEMPANNLSVVFRKQ
jgi:SAM-dependent methyltransferase